MINKGRKFVIRSISQKKNKYVIELDKIVLNIFLGIKPLKLTQNSQKDLTHMTENPRK